MCTLVHRRRESGGGLDVEPRVLLYAAQGQGEPIVLVPGGLARWVFWIPTSTGWQPVIGRAELAPGMHHSPTIRASAWKASVSPASPGRPADVGTALPCSDPTGSIRTQ